ncbi:acyltransferase [Winogradskyella poriferorum]|uniref:acyltransferase n=1 Tax=Winogradskyella poriferorum TaxID=307627 RepID=UPI003D6513B3
MSKFKSFLKDPLGLLLFVSNLLIEKKILKFKRKLLYDKYEIHPTVGIHLETKIYGIGYISIGENTYFGKNTFVVSNPKGARISIGKNCRISHGCHFRTEDNIPETLHQKQPQKKSEDIIIGDNCWIGANAFVRGGVTLGDNVTVGANSVVLSSFPSNVIIGGIPAKVLKTL